MLAAISIGAVLTLVLLISPSSKVNANWTSIPVVLGTLKFGPNKVSELTEAPNEVEQAVLPVENWDTFTVKRGDTLSSLFSKAGFNDKSMYQVLGSGNKNKELTRIFPGEKIAFLSDDTEALTKIKLIRSKLESVLLEKNEAGTFSSEDRKSTRLNSSH